MAKQQAKKQRQSRGARGNPTNRTYHDLNIPLPPVRGTKQLAALQSVIDRLHSTGYSVAAVSHTIFGKVRPDRDGVSQVFPFLLSESPDNDDDKDNNPAASSPAKRKRKSNESTTESVPRLDTKKDEFSILKRANIVIEDLDTVASYTGSKIPPVLSEYDIISITPRNDAIFAAACANATVADIVSLDYEKMGRLPFKLRKDDINSLIKRGGCLELCYGPAIVDITKRKAFVQIVRELMTATLNIKLSRPILLLTSGARSYNGQDLGGMALRTPSDMSNLLKTLTGLGDKIANGVMSYAALYILRRIRDRKSAAYNFELPRRVEVHLLRHQTKFDDLPLAGTFFVLNVENDGQRSEKEAGDSKTNEKEKNEGSKSDMDMNDGFISF